MPQIIAFIAISLNLISELFKILIATFAINQIKKRVSLESLIPFLLSFLLFLFALKDLRFNLIECLGFISILFYL